MNDLTDEELDAIQAERQSMIATSSSNFGKRMESVKVEVLEEAQQSDEEFVQTVKNTLKSAAVTSAEVEKEKASLEKQHVHVASEQLDRIQEKNRQIMAEDEWENKQKRREYHYKGVKPIMEFVNISSPMNLACLYFLTAVLMIPFLLAKLWQGTIGALICGACDASRPKAMKGFIWTLLGILMLCMILAGIHIFLKSQGIDILQSMKGA